MTESEFNDFRRDLADTWPNIVAWFKRLTPEQQASRRAVWFNACKPFSYAECLAAVEALAVVGQPMPEQLADDLRRQLTAMTKPTATAPTEVSETALPDSNESDPADDFFSPDVFDAWTLIDSRIRGGMSAAEATADICGPIIPEKEPRFKCLWCRDTGFVEVWQAQSIRAAINGTIDSDPASRMSGVMPCCCEKGDGKFREKDGPRFDFAAWCPCKRGRVNDPANIKYLKEWAQAKLVEARQNADNRQGKMW